jgi:uncharacterized protein (TIGR02246 family)
MISTGLAPSVLAKANTSEETIIRGIMRQWLVAYNSKDIDALMSLYSDTIYYANKGNSLIQSKEAIRRNYEPQFKAAPNVTIDFTEETVKAGTTLAHIAGKYRVNIPQADSKVTHAYGRVLLIFEKEDGHWKLIVDFDNTANDITAVNFEKK